MTEQALQTNVNYTPLRVQELKTPENKGGRPSELTEAIVQKLEAYFQRGLSVTKACENAHVSRRTFYHWMETDEGFLHRMTEAQNYLTLHAADNITHEIVKEKNPIYSWKLLEKKDPEAFGGSGITINNTNTNNNLNYVKTGRDPLSRGFESLFTRAEGVSQQVPAEGNPTQ